MASPRVSLRLFAALSCLAGNSSLLAQQDDARQIVRVTDNLYQALDTSHSTAFLVTEDGVILGDPLNESFAEWLKLELHMRFGATVRYVIYSHHHWDHASGGAVFADTARFVGHEAMVTALARALPLYGPSDSVNAIDADGDGRAGLAELTRVVSLSRAFSRLDTDNDGELTGHEINVDILPPKITYSERMKITLGGQTVELIHGRPAHSEDMTVLYFPAQRAVFAVDFVNVRRMPGPLFGFMPDDVVAAIDAVYDLGVDVFLPGHGAAGTGQDLADYLELVGYVRTVVKDGIERGLGLGELQRTIDLSSYSDWLLYQDRRESVVADAYEILVSR